MSKCYTAAYSIPAATLGSENPLPDIKNISYIHASMEATSAIPKKLTRWLEKGMVNTMLPYTQQDYYDRDRVMRQFKAVILENEHLKAVFLPELGGRLWSLIDKDTDRELLYRNPVFQPGNLALRNAWFSGGVEFNVSIRGHHPMTCSDMFAQHIQFPDGTPGVRFFEYERIRGTAYGFDAWIPDGSKVLLVRPRIENTTDHDVWTYWWSNIAVPYTDGMRVIVPADKTFINYSDENHYYLDFSDVPVSKGTDITFPKNVKIAQDFFFYIPDSKPKWIAAVDENGTGMMQCSTLELKGRKLFVWGDSHGGDNWKNFLSDGKNDGYVEIQAGLARTQLEHIPLPAGKTYSWVEAYGAIQENPDQLMGDWAQAQAAIAGAIEGLMSPDWLASLQKCKHLKARNGEMIHSGSGWGCLEQLRRRADNEKDLSKVYIFPELSLSAQQLPWLELLEQGVLSQVDPMAVPNGYLTDAGWRIRLEKALENPANQSWFSWMHLGLMRYVDGDLNGALQAMENSLAMAESPWVLRNLAMLWRNEKEDAAKAMAYMLRAVELKNDCRWLWIDLATTCLIAKQYDTWVEIYNTIPAEIRQEGRLKLYTAIALTKLGRLDEACSYLNYDLVVPDIKEDENLITQAWFELYGAVVSQKTGVLDSEKLKALVEEEYPLGELDFRMH